MEKILNKLSFCIHGHFYQPPRVDPFTGEIPEEYGASPYGNWTEKIFHECYLPNTTLGNFQKISFNIGATLFDWIDHNHPETAGAIIEQEAMVFKRTGFGNAMAQPYFHLIMPLASARDKSTMIHWGIRDYEFHFSRLPQGMWLPETAVDLVSLEAMADRGITFTILAPWQANDPNLDTTKPWLVELPHGKKMTVFFYNAFLSGEISFNSSATENADVFVNKWLIPQSESLKHTGDQLLMAATDGELYGHHQPFREKFLGYLMDGAVKAKDIQCQFPALWLSDHPVENPTEIIENTSWSCHHGIERWQNVCGDAPTATWKKPMRQFLNKFAESIDAIYEARLKGIIHDPWALRDDYCEVLLGFEKLDSLIQKHIITSLTPGQVSMIKLLLEAQFERLRMFSSDAWFLFDMDRIEPLNALKYASHAANLVERATGQDPSNGLISVISEAHSELSGLTGDMVFLGYLKKFENLVRQDQA
jgi:alpha-amylase/alpha-mannosidase (GH57 family)